jgi:outer membrane protein
MRRVFLLKNFIVASVCMVLTGKVKAQERMTLDAAVQYALAHTNSIKIAQSGITDADLQVKERLAGGLPQVNAEVGYQFFAITPKTLIPDFISPAVYGVLVREGVKDRTGNAIAFPAGSGGFFEGSFVQRNSLTMGVTASQLVYSGSYNVAVKAAKTYRKFVEAQVAVKQTEVRNQVLDVYMPALLVTEGMKTLDNNITNLEKLLKESSAIQKAGFSEQLDVDRLELSLANLRVERENLDRQKQLIVNGLKMVIQYPLDKPLEVADDVNTLLKSEVDLNEQVDYNNHSNYKLLGMAYAMNELNVEVNQAAYLPTVAAYASLQENLTGNNFFKKDGANFLPSSVIGIKATYNIWDNREKRYKIQRAQLALEQLKLQKEDLERAIQLQNLNARIQIQTAQKRVASQQKNIALAERIYKTTQTKYKEGLGSSLEIVVAEQQLYQSQQNLRQAQYDLLVAQKSLQKALGK